MTPFRLRAQHAVPLRPTKPTPIMPRPLVLLAAAALLLAGCGGDDPAADAPAPPASASADAASSRASGLAAYDADGDGVVYQGGMHPDVVQDEPGQCPICGMDLTPVRVDGASSEEGVIRVQPATLQSMGVRTATAEVAPLQRRLRTTGRFEASEEALRAVAPKVGGFVERLYVDYEGARVQEGQPLLALYSPELVATQEEYLLALRNAERLGGGKDAQRLVDAARRRLAYWDISEQQIRALQETGTPQKTLTLHAPASGTVTQKSVVEGQEIRAGQTLMHLADLGRLWLMLDLYEQDLAWIEEGDAVEIELPYAPGEPLTGRIEQIYDTLDPETRTARARVVVPNAGGRLKPGMYATATLTGGEAEARPVVPSEAVIRTGEEAVVILALGDGRFRPMPVEMGLEADGRVQILSGLGGGEAVVTSAQFLIDSEARLQSAVGAMAAGDHDHSGMSEMSGAGGPAAATAPAINVPALDANQDGQVFLCTGDPAEIADARADLPACETGNARELTIGAAQTLLHNEGFTAPVDPARSDKDGDGIVYQDAMDWAVIHDAPGRCEVCGMRLEKVTLDEARANLRAAGYAVVE